MPRQDLTIPFAIGATAVLAGLWALLRRGIGGGSLPIEALASHEPATTFDPEPKPGVLAFRSWGIDRWGERPGSPQNIGRWDKPASPSEHHEGRAWDLMTNGEAHGNAIVEDVLDNDAEIARRAGIMYMIWDRQMWRSYPWAGQPANTWGSYTGPNPHTDHVHFSFAWSGANGETTLYKQIGTSTMARLVDLTPRTPEPTD